MRNNKPIKLLLGVFVGFLFLLTIAVHSDYSDSPNFADIDIPEKERLEIIYLDVGQGDAILIKTPDEQNILIDGGPDNTVLNELGQHLSFFDHDIDIMILTHPHSDHVVGLTEVLKRYKVNQIYYTGVLHTSPDYISWLEEVKKQQVPLKIVTEPFDLNLGDDLTLEFLYPLDDLANQRVEELNNSSIVNRLVYKYKSFLFMGDGEIEEEELLLASGQDLSANVLKVGHHGSTSSSSIEFLQAVDPTIGIIQCGLDNEFDHPHLKTLRNLENQGIKYYRTDLDGEIWIISDGENVFTN